jgi:hypothetical protein
MTRSSSGMMTVERESTVAQDFLIRLEIGEMRNSVVKSFVSEIKGFIRFSSLKRPGG